MCCWFYLLAVVSWFVCSSNGATYYVSCDSCLNDCKQNTEITDCNVEFINKEEYSSRNEITAHKPNWENYSWYISQNHVDNNSLVIAFNLTWSQTGSNFIDTAGYVLSVTRSYQSYSFFRKLVVSLEENINPDDMIFINYPCYGKELCNNDVILPEYTYTLVLKSLPSYHIKTSSQPNEDVEHIFITCDDHKLSYTSFCIDEYDDNDNLGPDDEDGGFSGAGEVFPQTNEHQPSVIAIAVSFSIFVLILIALIITFCLKKAPLKTKSVLLLTSVVFEENHEYRNAVDLFGCILKKIGQLDVASIIWELTQSRNENYIEWMYDNLKDNCHIILVCTPTGLKNWKSKNKNDPFVIGLNMYLHEKKGKFLFLPSSHTFSVVYFDNNPSDCIPLEIIQHKHTNVGSHLSSFFFSLTGIKLPQDELFVKNFKKSVKSLQPQLKEEMFLLKNHTNVDNFI